LEARKNEQILNLEGFKLEKKQRRVRLNKAWGATTRDRYRVGKERVPEPRRRVRPAHLDSGDLPRRITSTRKGPRNSFLLGRGEKGAL